MDEACIARSRAGSLSHAPSCALPVVVWFAATLFLWGDIGLQQDDWFYVMRDAQTDQIKSLWMTGQLHFFRPLYRIIVPAMWTLCVDAPWIAHVVTAAVHGLCAIALFRLCRALRLDQCASMAGVLLYLLFPVHEQLMLWPTSMPTALGLVLSIEWLRVVVLYSQIDAGDGVRVSGVRGPNALLLGLAAAAFAIAAMNEQSVMVLCAAPIVVMLYRQHTLRHRLWLAAGAGAAIALSMSVYIWMHRQACPSIESGMGATVPFEHLGERISTLAAQIGEGLTLEEFAVGARRTGITTISARPFMTGVVSLFIIVSAVPWWKRCAGKPDSPHLIASIFAMLLGLAIFVLGWIPIARIYYGIGSRLHGPPMVGVAIFVAGFGSLLACMPWNIFHKGLRHIGVGGMLVGSLCCVVMMIGVQRAYRDRWERDMKELENLVALVPDPPADAVFIPTFVAWPQPLTGSGRFDFGRRDVFISWWSSAWAVRRAFHRRDIWCSWTDWQSPHRVQVDPERGVVSTSGGEFALDNAMLFRVDPHGNVSLVEEAFAN